VNGRQVVLEYRRKWGKHRLRGGPEEMKLSTHLIVGWMVWKFSKATLASAMVPWIPPAVAKPSTTTCWMYTPFFQYTHKYFLWEGKMGELR